MITIVLADDHPLVRQGLKILIELNPEFKIIGEANNGLDTVRLAGELHPDILIVDLMMPGLTGLEVTRKVTLEYPEIRVIVLSMHSSEAYVAEALKNGASGYVLKGSNADDLIEAVTRVAAGEVYLSYPLSEKSIKFYIHKPGAVEDPYDTLTTREREIFALVAAGHSSAEISALLCISSRTVEGHRSNILSKLGLTSQSDVIKYAIKKGIISID